MTRGNGDRGATIVEYALLVATFALVVALNYQALKSAVEGAYFNVVGSVGSVPEE